MDCDTCVKEIGTEPVARWKAPLLFVSALLFCPCHLPVTFAVLAATGAGAFGATWVLANKALVGAMFSLVYIAVVVILFRWLVRRRDAEKAFDAHHAAHAPQA